MRKKGIGKRERERQGREWNFCEERERREKQESAEERRRIYGNWKRMDA